MASATLGMVLLFFAWQQWQYFPNILKNGLEIAHESVARSTDVFQQLRCQMFIVKALLTKKPSLAA
jgi:hypothetical protein